MSYTRKQFDKAVRKSQIDIIVNDIARYTVSIEKDNLQSRDPSYFENLEFANRLPFSTIEEKDYFANAFCYAISQHLKFKTVVL